MLASYRSSSKMNIYYITGTSKGLGKALAEALLHDATHPCKVIGISRQNTIEHADYKHVSLDLADLDQVRNFRFDLPAEATSVVLINNAGIIGEVKKVGKLRDQAIIDTYNVNLVSPSILMNHFAEACLGVQAEKVVINVSSGAGKAAIDGWATYCATKAGLDLFSCTMEEEQKLLGTDRIKVLSVAPGIVDTGMQDQIRESEVADFSRIADFIDYKNTGKLAEPSLIAAKYLHILNALEEFGETLYSVRDIELNQESL